MGDVWYFIYINIAKRFRTFTFSHFTSHINYSLLYHTNKKK